MITTLSDRSIKYINQFIRENPDDVILGFGVISNKILHTGILSGKAVFVDFSESVLMGCKPFTINHQVLCGSRPDIIYAYNPKVNLAPYAMQFKMTEELQTIINSAKSRVTTRTIQL